MPRQDSHHEAVKQALRKDGWEVPSGKHDPSVGASGYRLEKIGWHPAMGPRPQNLSLVSNADRRRVLERDGSRCVKCGIGDGEPYPEQPERKATMTIGYRLSSQFGLVAIENS